MVKLHFHVLMRNSNKALQNKSTLKQKQNYRMCQKSNDSKVSDSPLKEAFFIDQQFYK